MDKRPTMDQMWALLQEQRAEIDRLKDELAAHKQGTSAEQQATVAVHLSRIGAGTGSSTGEELTAEVAGHEGTAENANGHHPEQVQPAPTRNGWHGRRGSKAADASGQQKLLPRPDDTTPAAIERRLSRVGLLKAVAAGIGGLAAIEVADTMDAPQAAAATPPFARTEFEALGGTGTAFTTVDSTYDKGVDVYGKTYGVRGESGIGTGILATSVSGDAVIAVTRDGEGVNASSVTAHGVQGQTQSDDHAGVAGVTNSTNGRLYSAGVSGLSLTPNTLSFGNGNGVRGLSNTGSAVFGGSYGDKRLIPSSGIGVEGLTGTGAGVHGVSKDGSGALSSGTGVLGESAALGVRGVATADGPYGQAIGVLGEDKSGGGIGVQGKSDYWGVEGLGNAVGVLGFSHDNTGVYGQSVSGKGVFGLSQGAGVWGQSTGSKNTGVYGIQTTNDGTGVAGRSYADGSQTTLGNGIGVWGDSGTGKGVLGTSKSDAGVQGESSTSAGVVGLNTGNGTGVFGINYTDASRQTQGQGTGVYGGAGSGVGVAGQATTGTGVSGYGGIGVQGTSAGSKLTGVYGIQTTNDGTGVAGRSFADGNQSTLGAGIGVWGDTASGIGVQGTATTGTGVVGSSKDASGLGIGISGLSRSSTGLGVGYGVQGLSNTGTGVFGGSYKDESKAILGSGTGVLGLSGSGAGVVGGSITGRGGSFWGGAAQLQLQPAAGSHPTSGQDGDLFLDSAKQLWLCTAGGATATWLQLGAGGSGGSGGPLTGHSTVAATPGVYGDNNTNDPNSIGISGASVDGSGNPGAGTGVLGSAGSGTGVSGTSGSGTGVRGDSASARGGVFSGGAAPLQLVPAGGSHPTSGQAGDLFVDSTNNLWFCQGGSTWVQLGPASGGGDAPLHGTSTSTAIAGVEGDNTQAGWGVRGRSQGGVGVQGEDTLGPGTGVYGFSSGGTGVAGQSSTGIGVVASGGAVGVYASSAPSNGFAVAADAGPGVGGRFKGATAQLQLTPLSGSRPASGTAGDLVVDSSNNLWFCQGGTSWKQLA